VERADYEGPGIVLSAIGARCGKCFKADGKWSALANAQVFLPNETFFRDYVWYLVNREIFWLKGGSAQPYVQIPPSINQRIPFPSFAEQRAIAEFLDRETAKIDELIAKKERLIELLEEKRAALITHAVTRGLNPDAPLRHSGIEWLGQIPKHWKVERLSRLIDPSRRITYGIVQPGDPDPSGRFMVRGMDYSFGWVPPEQIFRVSEAIERPYARSRLKPGDLLITIVGAGIGNTAVVPNWLDGANITQTTARLSIGSKRAVPLFVDYSLRSAAGSANVANSARGAAQPGLTLDGVSRFLIPLPDATEQEAIVEYLSQQMSRFDELRTHIETAMQRLTEYRSALITATVTGKIDVRNEVKAAA